MNLSYTIPKAEENILNGVKKHTFRTDKTNRWKPGTKIHHSYSFRSKHGYYCFEIGECVSVQKVLIVLSKNFKPVVLGFPVVIENEAFKLNITVDRKRMGPHDIKTITVNDGFETVEDFCKWFFYDHGKAKKPVNTMWAGKIIHWTNLKY